MEHQPEAEWLTYKAFELSRWSYRFQKEAFESFLSYQHNDGVPFPESGIASGNYNLIPSQARDNYTILGQLELGDLFALFSAAANTPPSGPAGRRKWCSFGSGETESS